VTPGPDAPGAGNDAQRGSGTQPDSYQPLAGITVVEAGRTRAAASAGRLLRLGGAAVSKLRLGVDYQEAARIYFDTHKTLVPAGDPAGLLASADVLVTDLPPDELTAVAAAPGELRERYPRLVIAVCRPVRDPGPATAGELSMQAGSGFMHMTGRPDREPLGVPYHLGAVSLGVHAAGAVTAALLRREATGTGCIVDLVGQSILASYLRIYGAVSEYYGIPLIRDGSRAPGSGGRYPFGIFPCADGYVAIIGRTARDWENIVAMMGNPPWAAEPRYTDLHGIAMDYPDEVDKLIDPWLRQHTRAELMELARQHSIPMAPVRRIDELPADPQLRHRRFLTTVTVDGHDYTVPGLPWRATDGLPPATRGQGS
jgi:crotonobetainyl-CoA:carnitine CoA-transferase CaiB-like acyl-CoA transferase